MTFQLLCPCGRAIEGRRQTRHQVVPCPGCGRATFVLPRSALAEADAPAPWARRWWRGPLVAGVGCLALLLLAFVVVLPRLIPPRDTPSNAEPPAPPDEIEAGRRLLRQGKFRLARQALDEAVRRRDRAPSALTPAEHRELNQLYRQADLLARLLPVTLAEVARRARLERDPQEWELAFDDFHGKAILLDGVVKRDRLGKAVFDDDFDADGERVRVAVDDLEALADLPLDDGPRVVFGARLASCEREAGGWVVRLRRDSGVLLTDLDAVNAVWTGTPDEGLKEVLARQEKWLGERAAPPVRPKE